MNDIKLVKELREETGCGVMDAKKALEEAGGDLKKAQEILKKMGAMKAEKKSDRNAAAAMIVSYVHDEKIGVLLEISAETDFVLKNDKFKELAKDITLQIAAMAPKDVKALLKQEYIKDPSQTVGDLVTNAVAVIGENIVVKRFVRYQAGE